MKIYAELYGNMQKYRIKSRYGNNLDIVSNMANELASSMKVVEIPSLFDSAKQALPEINTLGSTALELGKVGEQSPLSGKFSEYLSETTLSQAVVVTYLSAEGATHRW